MTKRPWIFALCVRPFAFQTLMRSFLKTPFLDILFDFWVAHSVRTIDEKRILLTCHFLSIFVSNVNLPNFVLEFG